MRSTLLRSLSATVAAVALLAGVVFLATPSAGAIGLGAPTSLAATPGDGSASISFTAGGGSPNNYEYQLDGGSWVALSPADTTSPVTIPSLTNGTTYSVKLRAVGAVLTGTASSAVSVTPAGLPFAPTSLVATPGNGSVSVAFTAGGNNGAAITNYEYRLDSGSWVASSPAVTTSPVTISGLTNGTTYSIALRAVNSVGSGAASDAASVSVPTTPSAPTSLSVINGNASAEISFTAGATGYSAITNYEYQIDGGSWVASSPAVTTSPVTISGLTNGTTYSVKLRAVNALGNGAASAAVSAAPSLIGAVDWTARTAAEANSWTSVTYGNGLYVAVASTGTNRVMTSPDGITWTARSAAEANMWTSVTYGDGLYVAVSGDGAHQVMTSPDGITWTARSAAEAISWYSVTYGDGIFVAVAYNAVTYNGTNRVMTSPDGITWTARTAAEANMWRSVTYGNGLFVAVGESGTHRVMTSPDGITWTARTAAEANNWQSVTYGNGLYVAVTDSSTHRVMTSPDGITWTARTAAEANSWRRVTYGNGLFVAVSHDGTHRVMTSPDGITWSARSAADANMWWSVTYGNGLFVAVSQSGTRRVMTSPLAHAPGAPSSLLATPGDASASIAFTAGADGNDEGITNYEYQLGSGSWTALSPTDSTSPVTIPGLTNGTTYSVRLRAVNSVGVSPASDAVSVTPISPISVPSAPTSLVATPGNGSVSVAFTAGADGGATITNYEYQLNGSGSWYPLSPTDASSPVTIAVTNGVTYTVKLRAVNSAGSGAASVASSPFTPCTVPSAPTGLVVTPGDGQVSISFTAGSNGGSAITKYQYRIGAGAWTDAVGSSPITITGVTNYTNPQVRVRAVNAAGAGTPSDVATARTRLTGPSLTSASATNRTSITVGFSGITILGATINGTTATAYLKGTTTAAASCNTNAAGRSCVIGGLTRNTEYDIRVVTYFKASGDPITRQTLDSNTRSVTTTN